MGVLQIKGIVCLKSTKLEERESKVSYAAAKKGEEAGEGEGQNLWGKSYWG